MSLSKIGKVSNAVKLLNTAATSGDIATGISSLSNSLRAAGNMSAGVNWISKYGKVLDSGIAYQALKQAFPEESLTEDMLAKIGYTANGAGKVGNASKFSSVGSTFAGLGTFLKSIWPVLAVVGGIAAGTAAWKWADDKFTITKATAKKHSDESAQAYQNAKTELSTKQSQYDTNQDRIHELRATQNRTSDENAELSQLTKENSLLGTQVSVQKKLVDAKAQQQAIDADMNLNKKYTTSQAVANEYSDSVVAKQEDIVEETTRKVNELAELQKKRDAAYQKLDQMSADDEGFTEQQNIANQMDDRVSKKQSEIADAMDEISDDYNRLFDEDTGALINPKTKDTAKSVEDLFSLYGRVTDSAQEETDRINNIFAKAKFDGVEDQLVNAGKSGGTDAVKAKISEIDGLQEALDNAGISADTLASNIMAIARPDEKNLEGIKENLKDIFDISADLNEGDNFVGPSGNLYNFFKDKTDKQIEDFWNYYSDQGLDGSDWNYMDLASNFNKSQEKAKIEAESKTFSSLFKNSAEDTATDLDTITDNFQTDMSNIKSSMDSIKSGTFQNSDITDLIQQFPELATETDNLQQGLQNLAFDKASDAIGKIRDSVKDVTDPKQLAAADKYIQSIMDTMDLSGFDMSNAKSAILGNLTKNLADKHMASVTTPNLVNQLMSEYGNDEIAVQAIMKLSLDPSMANADLDTWKSKIEDTKVQIQLDTSAKNLDNLSKELTRLQTDASDQQTRLNNKSAYNMKATASDYTNLIENGDKQIENLNNQIQEYQNSIDALKNSKGLSPLSDEDNEQIKQWQDQIQASQMSIENMKASQADWTKTAFNLPVTDMQNTVTALTSAISEMQTETGLTSDTMDSLRTQFSDLKDAHVDNVFDRTAKGLKINTERMKDYLEQQNEFMNSDFAQRIQDYQDQLSAGNKDYTQQGLENLKNLQAQYFAQYQEAAKQFSDFQAMVNADNLSTEGNEYTTAKSYLDNAKDLYDKGLVGTPQFKAAAKYFSQNGFEDADNFIENYNKLKNYYTDDASGPKRFLSDLEAKGLATYKTLEDGNQQWMYSFTDTQEAADAMGMSLESFESMFGRLKDYGDTNNFVSSLEEGALKSEEIDDKLIDAQIKMGKLKAKFTVLQGLNYDGIIEPSEDWYTSFVNMILGHVAEAKQYADEAKASAASINVDDIKADVKTSVMNDLNGTVTESLKAYYTKTEVDTKVKELNTAISGIDSLKNLKVEYDNTTGNLVFKDGTEPIGEPITINSLANLIVEYSVINGKGSLVFKDGETIIQTVELSSIEPSAEWRAALKQELEAEMDEKDTVISNRIGPLETAKTEIEKNVNANTTAVSEIKTTISNIEKKVESATTKSDEAKNAVDILKQNMTSYDTQFEGINTDITDVKAAIEEIKKNPAAAEYDVTYENSIFTFLKDGEIQKSFKIEGGGGSSSDTTTITIERITNADAIFLLGSKAIIEYSFSSVDNTGDTTGAGTAVWKVGNTIVATNTAAQGNNSFDITEYLNVGANTIRLTITDSFGTLATKTWTVTIVEFKLESTFDDTLLYTNTDVVFRYTPYGNVNKTLHLILDGKDLGTVETQSSGRIMSYNIPKQEHGSHLLKVYMTATINNKEITSNTICKDIICVDPTNRTPIIGCAQQEFTAQQYQATSIKYVVYDPDHNPASVKLSIDGKVQSTLSVNRSAQIWSYKSSTEGKHNLTISCRKVTKILSVNITKLDIDVEPITANLAFDFNPVGKSNGDTDRLWADKNNSDIALSVSDNFDWDNGGYQIDASGNQYFCVKAGTTAQINYNLFGKDPKQTGSEFKFVFKTQNVRNASATFLSCIDGTEGSDVGIKMDVHEAYVNTSTDSLYFPYSEEDIIEFEYNINTIDTKDTSATSIIMTYEDGVGGRPLIYDNSHRLHQYSPAPISIGSPDCDVLIYRMKAYSASLTDSDILANFIADARDSDEMIARYNRNQIYNDNNALTPDSVANACPNLRIIKIEAPHFTNDKKDFVKNTSMECIYKNGDPKLDNWKFINCFHAGQGTTSNEYGFAARNIDVICCADGVHQINSKIPLDPNYKTELVLGDGTKYEDGTGKISLTRNSVPNNWWNFKVNVASSNMATNALGQKRFNDFLPYESPAVRRDPKVKNSMEFVNCVIFIKESDPDITTHREFQDTDWHFYSLGNMGDSKKTDITRAYDPEDMKEFCIEISDNTLPNSAFQTGITNQDGTMKYPISKAEWKTGNTAYDALYNNWDGSFEFRYDCCGDSKDGSALTSDEAKKKIRTDNKQIWRDFYEFVITSSDKEFKDGLKDWCIQDAMLYFYLVTLRYSMIDNRAKNVFPHWAKHYITQEEATTMGDKAKYYTIDDDAAALHNGYRFDLWAYDMDTQLGINNSGELSFPYGKEDTDYKEEGNPSSGYVFNAAESVLWCRIRDVFTQELRNMYQSVDSNCWSDSHLINEYEAWQSQFPEELWRIHYERLYLRTYRAGTVRFLNEMMNGRGKYHLRQWERDQHIYMGTKFLHTDVKSDQIMFRCNTPKKVVVKPDYTLKIIPYSDMYISVLYGNSPETTQVRAKAGQEYKITTDLTNMDDTAILIYAASRIEALNDLSACYIHDNDFSKASKLKTLIIGNNTAGYQNTFMTSLNMGNNTLLETLDIRNCPNLTGSVNLSACENLINLYADGTIVTSVLFANHGKIAHASLPSSINTLTLKNLKDLTDLNLEDKSTVVDYINSLSYNKLFDVPIVNLIGTLTVPVKISSLDDGIYKVKGQCIIGGNNTTVQSSADDVLYLVSHDADTSSTTITKMQMYLLEKVLLMQLDMFGFLTLLQRQSEYTAISLNIILLLII